MPLDEIKAIYDSYLKQTEEVNKKKDDFFSTVSGFKGQQVDDMFNMLGGKTDTGKDKDSFFQDFGLETIKKTPSKKNSSGEY